MGFEVKLETFSGPLQLLLDFIEKEELTINTVSLSIVADDYLNYINTHQVPAEDLADFLIIASKLLYIKSQSILPIPDTEDEVDAQSLAAQLKMYREFVKVSAHIKELYESPMGMFAPSHISVKQEREFRPGNIKSEDLFTTYQKLIKRISPFLKLKEASMERIISVKERIRYIHDLVIKQSSMTFRSLIHSGSSKVDVVVSFLALLELVKQQVVNTAQGSYFEEIIIKHVD
jgi:segregation and condensation protein A